MSISESSCFLPFLNQVIDLPFNKKARFGNHIYYFPQQVAYTFDAGPNAVLIAKNRKTASLLLQRLLFYFPPPTGSELTRSEYFNYWLPICCPCVENFIWFRICSNLFSYLLGDKSILQESGVQSMKDVEDLQPPLETKDKTMVQRYVGDVSYFICTKIGRGPTLLADEGQALLSSETGLPKWVNSVE